MSYKIWVVIWKTTWREELKSSGQPLLGGTEHVAIKTGLHVFLSVIETFSKIYNSIKTLPKCNPVLEAVTFSK